MGTEFDVLTGERALKILEECYHWLKDIPEEDLTQFEKNLLRRISREDDEE